MGDLNSLFGTSDPLLTFDPSLNTSIPYAGAANSGAVVIPSSNGMDTGGQSWGSWFQGVLGSSLGGQNPLLNSLLLKTNAPGSAAVQPTTPVAGAVQVSGFVVLLIALGIGALIFKIVD